MGLMNSALQIGRSALLSYQSALQVIGNNISSVGSPGYTRLTPGLDPLQGGLVAGDLQPGAGVALTGIQRNIDEALEQRLRLAIGDSESTGMRQSALSQVEPLFDDLSGAGIGSRLTDFFNSFDEVQNTPESIATQELAVRQGVLLADAFKGLRANLASLGAQFDSQIGGVVKTADELAEQIARLNQEITTAEAGGRGQATGLRDQRDAMLRRLSELFDVTVREQTNGAVNVYIGSEALVQGSLSRGLVAVTQLDGEFARTTVRFADSNSQIQIKGGQLHGLILARDEDAYGRIAAVDTLAAALIEQINQIHADGQGNTGFKTLESTGDVLALDASLGSASAGLSPPPTNGSFFITVTELATGTPVAHRIDVSVDDADSPTTLESLAADITANVAGVTANITSDNRLQLIADEGTTFTFGHDGQQVQPDSSGVLAALGLNTMFTGTNASNIAVSDTLLQNPALLASAQVFLPGDGSNAARIAELSTVPIDLLRGKSVLETYNGIATKVAIDGSAALADVDAARTILFSLQAQRESISGVNLDEEAIALLKFESAFQGAARYVRVVDGLLDELIALIR